MHRLATFGLCVGCAASILGASCTSPPARSPRFVVRQTHAGSRDAAFEASERALKELDYVVANRDKAAGRLKTRPVPGGTPDRAHGRSRRVSSASDMRRVAEVRVDTEAEKVLVYCRVLVQEQTSQSHRAFSRDQAGHDAPTETAIEQDAGATAEQNAVWRTVGQDGEAERRILSTITRLIGKGG